MKKLNFSRRSPARRHWGFITHKPYENVRQRGNELSALYSIADSSSKFLDINTVLREASRQILRTFDLEAACIYVRDDLSEQLRVVTHEGFHNETVLPSPYPLSKEWIRKEVLAIDDLETVVEFPWPSHRQEILSAGFRRSITVPILLRGQILGLMNFLGKKVRHFSHSDIQLINTVSYHLGVALGNATLFFELKQKSLELEKSNKVKDEFLGIISHELRTSLNVSMGYTNLVKDRVFGDINFEQEVALGKALKQSQKLLALINDVLSLQTSEEDGKEQFQEFRVEALLDELKTYYTEDGHKKLSFCWNYRRDLPTVRSDPEKLKQVLRHLLDNAVKFTEEGKIMLCAECVDNALEFTVTDTGIGIAEENILNIFEMFRQGDNSHTRNYEGIGIGLFVVKKFMEILGGTVRVASEVNKGATFIVRIPIGTPAPRLSMPVPDSIAQ